MEMEVFWDLEGIRGRGGGGGSGEVGVLGDWMRRGRPEAIVAWSLELGAWRAWDDEDDEV